MNIASILSALTPLAFLACPIGMGVMMWMMAKGVKKNEPTSIRRDPAAPAQPAAEPTSVEVLREEQRRLAEEIERLERRQDASPEPSER